MVRQIVFNSFHINDVIQVFAKHYGVQSEDEGVEQSIKIPSRFGFGEITGLDFQGGLSILIFDAQLKEETILKFRCRSEQPLRLIFCLESEINHSVKSDSLNYRLSSLVGSMVSGKPGSEHQYKIPSGQKVIFYCIDVDRKKYHSKISKAIRLMPVEIKNVFEDTKGSHPFLYVGGYSLEIAKCIQNIKHNDYKAIVRRVYIESQTLEIMSMIIKQFIDDMEPGRINKSLRKRDMQIIAEAKEKLLADLVKPPTIKELAQMMGTNENKLKAGFRILYKTSINKMLQDERLVKARSLMADEVYPIKEVAMMVGYKHPAHFASKFKKRFGILPNEYLKSLTRK